MTVEKHRADMKDALEELKRSNDHLQAAISARIISRTNLDAVCDSMPYAVIIINTEGIITESLNATAVKLLGYSKYELINRNVNILMPEEWRNSHDAYIKAYLATGIKNVIGITRNVQAVRKDGVAIHIELSVSEFDAYNEKFFVGIIREL